MPRQPEPEGRRNNVCARLSDAEFAQVEAARGEMNRSEWARLAMLAAAERQQMPTVTFTGIPITADDRYPPGLVSVVSDGHAEHFLIGEDDQPQPPARNCRHRNFRGVKGICTDCHQPVGYKNGGKP